MSGHRWEGYSSNDNHSELFPNHYNGNLGFAEEHNSIKDKVRSLDLDELIPQVKINGNDAKKRHFCIITSLICYHYIHIMLNFHLPIHHHFWIAPRF